MSIVVPLDGFGGGGGTSLNFKVVGNPQPASPKGNTIWIDTDVPITSWIFSATQPETVAEGIVWISTGTSSSVEFNALKKNGITVYPISAKQYVNGAWVDKTAKTYQNGEWVDWTYYLYNEGNLFTNITGGWSTDGLTTSSGNTVYPPTFNSDNMVVGFETSSTAARWSAVYTKEKIKITEDMKNMYCNFTMLKTDGSSSHIILDNDNVIDERVSVTALSGAQGSTATAVIDISAITGEYYVGFTTWVDKNKVKAFKVNKVWIE